jgi:hypothetical protein
MSAEDNLSPKQFKWTPNKYGRDVLWHMRREHTDMTPQGGWSRTGIDERAHEAAHAAERVAYTAQCHISISLLKIEDNGL